MPNHRRGYIGQDKRGQWFARTTITDEHGKRRNISRRAKDKSEARSTLKALIRQLDDEGCKAVDYARPTFVDLADFYTAHYLKPAEYINGRKASGMKDWKHAAIYLRVFKEHFGRRLI